MAVSARRKKGSKRKSCCVIVSVYGETSAKKSVIYFDNVSCRFSSVPNVTIKVTEMGNYWKFYCLIYLFSNTSTTKANDCLLHPFAVQ